MKRVLMGMCMVSMCGCENTTIVVQSKSDLIYKNFRACDSMTTVMGDSASLFMNLWVCALIEHDDIKADSLLSKRNKAWQSRCWYSGAMQAYSKSYDIITTPNK